MKNKSLLEKFISKSQLSCIESGLRGEEKNFFIGLVDSLSDTIKGMPYSYQTDGKGDKAIAYLHYFKGGYDCYVTERDMGMDGGATIEEQIQAFGMVKMHGGDFELGYISIVELIANGIQLDFHFNPCTLGELKSKK